MGSSTYFFLSPMVISDLNTCQSTVTVAQAAYSGCCAPVSLKFQNAGKTTLAGLPTYF